MGKVKPHYQEPVVILANGEFPRHHAPLKALTHAKTLICTDGGAHKALAAGFSPTIVIGDLDSLTENTGPFSAKIVHMEDQANTDLEKALDWCIDRGIRKATLLGISGGREDLTLSNFFALQTYASRIELTAITDHFTVVCVRNYREFPSSEGQKVSILPFQSATKATTTGLRYALNREPLRLGGQGISNEAIGDSFSIEVGGKVLVFIAHQR